MNNQRRYSPFHETGRKGNHLCRSSGFTLIELVVTMVMGAILMSIAIPYLQSISKHHAAEELVSELHLAGMMATRLHRPVTATFINGTSQCAIKWAREGAPGVFDTKMVDLGANGERFVFNNKPPGGPAVADASFTFSPQGFISTPNGNMPGNIYLTNQNNSRWFQIQTTIAGGIDLNVYDAGTNTWGPAH